MISAQPQSPRPATLPTIPNPGLLRRATTFFSQGGNRSDAETQKITADDRDVVERILIDSNITPGGFGKAVPVWMGDDEDGGLMGLTVGQEWERWGMLSQKSAYPDAMRDIWRSQLTHAFSTMAATTLYPPDPHRWGIGAAVVERLSPIQHCICRQDHANLQAWGYCLGP